MAKRKSRSDGIVYSTNPDYDYDEEAIEGVSTLSPEKQNLRIHLDRLKGNKKVTRIANFEGSENDLKSLGKDLKQACGCGGTAKSGVILLQGDFREKVGQALKKLGYRYKFSGG